jgi:two-component system NtrC family sensor kinase
LTGLAYLVVYAAGAWLLREHPFARSIFGNIGLLAPAITVCVLLVLRRRHWQGCQRLFWDTVGVGIGLWIIGHLGWAYEEIVYGSAGWLGWHTLFRLSGGIFPLIALLARPHLGIRSQSVTAVGLLVASYGLLAVFLYAYFVLVPSQVLPAAEAQLALLGLVQVNRGVLAAGFLAIAWTARHGAWRVPYLWMAAGLTAGFLLRLSTSGAILQGSYEAGTLFDLAWVAPFVCYAYAALAAPRSASEENLSLPPATVMPATWAAVPVLLIPLIGYSAMWLQPLGPTVDSFRALLTGLVTVAGLGFLTLRLGIQGGELQRTDARLRLLAAATEQTQDLIVITRADGRVEHANDAFVRALGYSREELSRSAFPDLLAEGFHEVGARIREELRQRGVWRGTLLRRRRDGSSFPAACTVTALRERGAITHMVGVERDITEELRLQEQLVQTERLSAIGELVAGVAHEINNPLQTVVGSVELMLEDHPSAAARQDLETVRREAARAAQIVRSLLAFVRRGTSDRAPVDVNEIVQQAVSLRAFQIQQKAITLTVDLVEAPVVVRGSRDELQQVVMNLLLNAEQAVDTGGRGAVAIRTSSSGGHHVVEVADNGPGVGDELRGRIFEPFFTTKPVGEGTGLGLSISHGIAAGHGGTLELVPSERGAAFRLLLPAADAVAPAASVRADVRPAQEGSPGRPSALVVDDEPSITRLIARLLRKRGFAVIEAASGEEALALVRTTNIAVVFCDIRMPGISGLELYDACAAAGGAPPPPFVFMTGDRGTVDGVEGARILAKPFTASELDEALAAILDTRP